MRDLCPHFVLLEDITLSAMCLINQPQVREIVTSISKKASLNDLKIFSFEIKKKKIMTRNAAPVFHEPLAYTNI